MMFTCGVHKNNRRFSRDSSEVENIVLLYYIFFFFCRAVRKEKERQVLTNSNYSFQRETPFSNRLINYIVIFLNVLSTKKKNESSINFNCFVKKKKLLRIYEK